jgi:hypothetical protein
MLTTDLCAYADLVICFQCVLCDFFLLNIYDQNVTVTILGRDWDVLYDKFSAKTLKGSQHDENTAVMFDEDNAKSALRFAAL